jgi:hypothetical protein
LLPVIALKPGPLNLRPWCLLLLSRPSLRTGSWRTSRCSNIAELEASAWQSVGRRRGRQRGQQTATTAEIADQVSGPAEQVRRLEAGGASQAAGLTGPVDEIDDKRCVCLRGGWGRCVIRAFEGQLLCRRAVYLARFACADASAAMMQRSAWRWMHRSVQDEEAVRAHIDLRRLGLWGTLRQCTASPAGKQVRARV